MNQFVTTIAIFGVILISLFSLVFLGEIGKDIAIAGVSGLIGFLSNLTEVRKRKIKWKKF